MYIEYIQDRGKNYVFNLVKLLFDALALTVAPQDILFMMHKRLYDYRDVELMDYRSIRWCTTPRKFGKVITTSFPNSDFRT